MLSSRTRMSPLVSSRGRDVPPEHSAFEHPGRSTARPEEVASLHVTRRTLARPTFRLQHYGFLATIYHCLFDKSFAWTARDWSNSSPPLVASRSLRLLEDGVMPIYESKIALFPRFVPRSASLDHTKHPENSIVMEGSRRETHVVKDTAC